EDTEEYHKAVAVALRLCEQMGLDAAEISGWSSARAGMPEEPYFIHNIRNAIQTSLQYFFLIPHDHA
ncbi:MAG: hypothetical protein IKW40_00670, partial [Anaerotignum sp.]|nr:hypothetical protein [Anaerotignum sp.]